MIISSEIDNFKYNKRLYGSATGYSCCCGNCFLCMLWFWVFVPMQGASFAAWQQWYALPADMQWMGPLPALLCFATAAVLGIAAYYIPFADNLHDTIATALAVAAGTVLAVLILLLIGWILMKGVGEDDEELRGD